MEDTNKNKGIGPRCRDIIEKHPIAKTRDLAQKLGQTEQAVYLAYEKEHVNTKFLSAVMELTNVDCGVFFNSDFDDNELQEEGTYYQKYSLPTQLRQKDAEIERLKEKLQLYEDLIKSKNEVIKLYREGKNPGKKNDQ